VLYRPTTTLGMADSQPSTLPPTTGGQAGASVVGANPAVNALPNAAKKAAPTQNPAFRAMGE